MAFTEEAARAVEKLKTDQMELEAFLRQPEGEAMDRLIEIDQERDRLEDEEAEIMDEWYESEEYREKRAQMEANKEELKRITTYLESGGK